MFYNSKPKKASTKHSKPSIKSNKANVIVKYSLFLMGILLITGVAIAFLCDDLKMPQRRIILKVDIENKVNICLPEDDKIFEESFFNF